MEHKEQLMAKPLWAFDVQEVISQLKTTRYGLTDKEARERLKHFGLNQLAEERDFSKVRLFLKQFQGPLIFILIGAGALTLFLGKLADTAVIFLAIAVNTALGFYQENRAEEALQKLRSYVRQRARVTRDGKEREIPAEELVPGDLIYLGYGSRVPADARLILVEDLAVDESILTGESLPVEKDLQVISEAASLLERKNMVFGGTLVVGGYGSALVTATGRATEIGKIAESLAKTKRAATPLQQALSKLAWIIAAGFFLIVAGIFILGILRGQNLFDMLLISAAVAVGAIPEALPISLTVILAVGVEQLAKRKGIMRNLAAAETLGSTTTLIVDKTGTLTKADMKLVDIITADDLIAGRFRDHKELKELSQKEKEILRLAVFNTTVLVENPDSSPEEWQIIGKALETHIVKSAARYGLDPIGLKQKTDYHLVIPFSSQNKFSVSLIFSSPHFFSSFILPSNLVGRGARDFYVILGAPDVLLERAEMEKQAYIAASERVEKLSGEGKRLLGVGVLPVAKSGAEEAVKIVPEEVKNIIFAGLLAFYDPIRPGVPEDIRNIEASGVKVIMATGDLEGTAVAVAKELGWEVTSEYVLTGEELRQISDEELLENIQRIKIFARVTPQDKLRIGKLLRQKGEVVGMTGDGVNDAPSLKAVDIGIAIGSGSDVAKEVADLVLLDDNFETITGAIEEGRRILNNIKKSFVYLMSNSLDEVILIGGALLAGLQLPLTALQIIWVNFFTESLPAVAFAFDNSMDQKKGTEVSSRKILDAQVKTLALGIGTLVSFLLFGLYWVLVRMGIEYATARTFLYACFGSYVLFIAFSLRSLKKPIFSYNIFSNRALTLGVVVGLFLLSATIYAPFLQSIFGTTALSAFWLFLVGVWVVMNVGLVEIVKWWYRNR